jgi:hypothetical protein
MINRQILQELKEKTGLSDRRVYELIDEMRKNIKAYSRETAANVLAAEKGVDIYSILGNEEVKEVREALGILHAIPVPRQEESKKTTRKSIARTMRPRVIQMPGMEKIDIPNLPTSIVNEAFEMSQVYPYIYLFENSLRAFIKEVLDEENPDWWNNVRKNTRERVERKMADETKNRYHGRRGVHPIQYVDFDDLRNIIAANREHFEEYMPDHSIEWIQQRLREAKDTRNILMHCNPLKTEDVQRIKLYFGDWVRQISGSVNEISIATDIS